YGQSHEDLADGETLRDRPSHEWPVPPRRSPDNDHGDQERRAGRPADVEPYRGPDQEWREQARNPAVGRLENEKADEAKENSERGGLEESRAGHGPLRRPGQQERCDDQNPDGVAEPPGPPG